MTDDKQAETARLAQEQYDRLAALHVRAMALVERNPTMLYLDAVIAAQEEEDRYAEYRRTGTYPRVPIIEPIK